MKHKRKTKSAYSKDKRLNEDAVLQALRQSRKPMTIGEVLRKLKVYKKQKYTVIALLEGLVSKGKVIELKRGAWALPERMRMVTGTLEVQRSRIGFVIQDDKRKRDVFISPANFGDAWHGDRVAAVIINEKRGRNPEGRIVRVIERAAKAMPCRVERSLGKRFYLCQPSDFRQRINFMLEQKKDDEPITPGDIVLVDPVEQIDQDLWSCTLTKRFGKEADPRVQEALVKSSHGIPTAFPADVLAEAEALPEVPAEADFAGREDIRDIPLVTIDGAKARDFDDAVCVKRTENGYKLWVAIADVSHYVPMWSKLDREAYERGNSYYFPQSVEPMLPEKISNGLCSLNPHVPRLCMVAEMDFSEGGKPGKSRFYPAVMESHARLTYAQVNRALLDKDEDERREIGDLMPMLELCEELARKIQSRRFGRGSLDFDLPEPEIHFNMFGETIDIRPKVRRFGHQIIEEFMVAANEAVAEFMTRKEIPVLYRVHPEPSPEKLEGLFKVLERSGLEISRPEEITPSSLQDVLKTAEGTDQEFLVGRMVLRAMMQASYSPENEGHFGLASECYSHFTSPIRRYADLTLHRALKRALGDESIPFVSFKQLQTIGDAISATERKAMEAEREMFKRITVLFLRDRIGEEFTGIINSVADFGFWVELNEVMAEGLVRLSSLDDDYYGFLRDHQVLLGERTGRAFKLGQTVNVILEEVNLPRLEITLRLNETQDEPKESKES